MSSSVFFVESVFTDTIQDVSGGSITVGNERWTEMTNRNTMISSSLDGEEKLDFLNRYTQQYIVQILRTFGLTLTEQDVGDDFRNTAHSANLFQVLQEVLDNGTVSEICVRDLLRLFTDFASGHTWAIQILDSIGKPGPSITRGWWNFVGNYHQCTTTVAPALSNSTENSSTSFTGSYYSLPFQPLGLKPSFIEIKLGACFPSTCDPRDVWSLVRRITEEARLPLESKIPSSLTGKTEFSTSPILAVVLCCFLSCFILIGTIYDLCFFQRNHLSSLRDRDQYGTIAGCSNAAKDKTKTSGYDSIRIDEQTFLVHNKKTADHKPKTNDEQPNNAGAASKIFLAFSLYSNGKKVFNTSQTSGTVTCIHGIRFLSLCWVTLSHCYGFSTPQTINFLSQMKTFRDRWTFDTVSNALVPVDTFFTLSGLLTAYLTITELKRRKLKISWAQFYFHRFWRLTPPYMFAVLFVLGFQKYLGQGPLWEDQQPSDKNFCEKHWWTNLLYINNLVHRNETCFFHTWYLANDMQFFILSPLMLIPFYFHWLAGVATCTFFLLTSWTTTGLLSAANNWGTTISSVNDDWFLNYYIAPWCRIGPYIVGIMAGSVLVSSKGQTFRMKWWFVALGWTVSAISALAIVYGVHGDVTGEHPSGREVAALYNAVGRSVWAACVCWVVIACSAGYGGPINTLLSWPPFIVLGRLTYMTYLLEFSVIDVVVGNMGMPYYLNDMTFVLIFIGILVITSSVAFVFTVTLESPMIGLEKALLRKRHTRN